MAGRGCWGDGLLPPPRTTTVATSTDFVWCPSQVRQSCLYSQEYYWKIWLESVNFLHVHYYINSPIFGTQENLSVIFLQSKRKRKLPTCLKNVKRNWWSCVIMALYSSAQNDWICSNLLLTGESSGNLDPSRPKSRLHETKARDASWLKARSHGAFFCLRLQFMNWIVACNLVQMCSHGAMSRDAIRNVLTLESHITIAQNGYGTHSCAASHTSLYQTHAKSHRVNTSIETNTIQFMNRKRKQKKPTVWTSLKGPFTLSVSAMEIGTEHSSFSIINFFPSKSWQIWSKFGPTGGFLIILAALAALLLD